MTAFLIIIYTAVVLVLFKVLRLKPTPYLIAGIPVAGVLTIGGVVVIWMQSAPISDNVVTNQYVVQLVPYVKGQITKVHAQANQLMKKGDLLLEIDPASPYQYALDQLDVSICDSGAEKDVTPRDEVICQVCWHVEILRDACFPHSLPGLLSGARYRGDVLEFEYRCSDVVTEQNFFNFFLWKSVLSRARAN